MSSFSWHRKDGGRTVCVPGNRVRHPSQSEFLLLGGELEAIVDAIVDHTDIRHGRDRVLEIVLVLELIDVSQTGNDIV